MPSIINLGKFSATVDSVTFRQVAMFVTKSIRFRANRFLPFLGIVVSLRPERSIAPVVVII